MKCTFGAYKGQFVAGILPRLLFSGFTFAQPFLIESIVDYVGMPVESRSNNVSAGLIGATALVYMGLAITGAWYKHMTYRLLTMYRGGLASLVFRKTLTVDAYSIRESAPITLMSTDVENIVLSGGSIHDTWASFLELPIAIYILRRYIGFPSLFIIIPGIRKWISNKPLMAKLTKAVSSCAIAIISPALAPARVKWNKAIQERVGITAGMLIQMKAIKMMGLTDFFRNNLSSLRAEELKLSSRFRWLQVHINSIGKKAHTPGR